MAGPDRERSPVTGGWRVEGARKSQRPRFRPSRSRAFWITLVVMLGINWYGFSTATREPVPESVPYSFFREQVAAGQVEKITAHGLDIQGVFKTPRPIPGNARAHSEFRTRVPDFAGSDLLPLLVRHHVVVTAKAPEGPSLLVTIALGFGPTLLLVVLLVMLMRRFTPGTGALGGLTRSRARRYQDSAVRTTFADVAGIDEATEELVEIVDFLRTPERYTKLGAAIPKGVLLYGPPGTGKTLLARSVAGEAGVPFFSLSASEFVEIVAGVGAGRVRDLFKTAREEAPAIVFIDELDAIGKRRSGGALTGGQDEREQTLNQILTEMDGFAPSDGVVVIASTNRPEILDSALLRPGRFDRRISVNPPDIRGRRAILEVHTRGVPLAPDVDLQKIAADTPGMVGADLRNLVNEAALTAARRSRDEVNADDFGVALERIVLGAERRLVLSPEDRERTAYHEAGHALAGILQAGGDPVRKVSIVPRGGALGITFQRPDTDRYGYTAQDLFGRLVFALGGRAAEELVYGVVTTGPEGDLDLVTSLARQMVGRWGMSDAIGPVSVVSRDADAALSLGPEAPAEQTRELVDAEIRRLVDRAYERALEHLRDHREQLDRLAAALLERETLDEDEIYAVVGIPRTMTDPLVEAT